MYGHIIISVNIVRMLLYELTSQWPILPKFMIYYIIWVRFRVTVSSWNLKLQTRSLTQSSLKPACEVVENDCTNAWSWVLKASLKPHP